MSIGHYIRGQAITTGYPFGNPRPRQHLYHEKDKNIPMESMLWNSKKLNSTTHDEILLQRHRQLPSQNMNHVWDISFAMTLEVGRWGSYCDAIYADTLN